MGFCPILNLQGCKTETLHRFVGKAFLDNPENKSQIDHIDNNRTNNYYKNLRWCSNGENGRNKTKYKNCSSSYKGVNFDKEKNKWVAAITINKKRKFLGRFDEEIEAARCWNNYIREKRSDLLDFYVLNDL